MGFGEAVGGEKGGSLVVQIPIIGIKVEQKIDAWLTHLMFTCVLPVFISTQTFGRGVRYGELQWHNQLRQSLEDGCWKAWLEMCIKG